MSPKLVLTVALFATLACSSCSRNEPTAAASSTPTAVSVRAIPAVLSDVPREISAIGNVEAISTVEVKPRITAPILRVRFSEGEDVRQGQLLFELDAEPYRQQISELEANIAKDLASEKQAEANIAKDLAALKNAQAIANRGKKLSDEGIFSREQTDQVISNAESANASLEADRAAAESAKATERADRSKLAQLHLQLSYTEVHAPIAGRAGAIPVKQGSLAKENDTTLVTILQVAPIYVSFSVPEDLLPEIRKYNAGHPLTITSTSADGKISTGSLQFIDSAVDTTTGTIKLKAAFTNGQRTLWPGQFVNVHARLSVEQNRILIPSRTVQTGPQGKYVWIIHPTEGTASIRNVQVLRSYTVNGTEQSVIGSGLQPGEKVVSEGQLRLTPGARVQTAGKYAFRSLTTMRITDFFIRHAVTTTLLMAAILGFGLLSYFALPVSDLPSVEYPTIQVSASLPGANPDIMASSVATPLEKEFSIIAGIASMSSSSSLGSTSITLQFDLSRSIDAAAQDVQAAISRAGGNLPSNMPAPPSYSKINPASRPVLYMSISSQTMSLPALDEYAETLIARRLSMVSGVAQVQVYGAKKYAVRIQADPDRLAAREIGLEELRDALGRGNVNLPAGSLYGWTKAYTVQSNSQLNTASQFRPMIITYRNGNPVRLQEVASVLDSVTTDKSVFWVNGELAMILAVTKQPGMNTVEVVEGVKQLLPTLKQNMPAGIKLETEFDASQNIRDSIRDVKFTLFLTIALVILVIFVFLRNVSATVIPSLAVPLSLLGTFAVMRLLNFTIDTLSMMAMTLSVGFVVDDAIVMLENIVRHMEMGKPRLEAALEGAREVGFTIISMTISLVAVFVPVLFLEGIIGRLLREFSITIAVAVLISGLISLTLTPMLCSRFLHHSHTHGRLYASSEVFFEGWRNLYRRTLEITLRYRLVTLLGSIALTVATVYMFSAMPKSFLPTVDTGLVFGNTEAAEDTSYDEMVKLQRQAMEVVKNNRWVSTFGTGTGGFSGQNQGFMFMHFKDDPKRPRAPEIIAELQQGFAKIPGLNVFLQSPPLLTLGQNESRYQYSVALQDADVNALYTWAPKLETKLRSVPGIQEVYSDLHLTSPRVNVDIDRDRALALGVTPDQIANTLYDAYGNRRVSTITAASNEYDVLLEVLPGQQRNPEALSKLYIRSSSNKLVPLSAVTRVIEGVAPLSVNHIGQLPAVNFEFNTSKGVSLSEATQRIDKAARELGLAGHHEFPLPRHSTGISKLFKGIGAFAWDCSAGDLPCTRRPVRELYSPDYHSFRPACCRVRRINYLAAVS